jgi:XTP/dITP diphosphohydrolase
MRKLLSDLPLEIVSLGEYPNVPDVDETGSTFRDNAELKAREFARQVGDVCLADDSGLEVTALGGAPGVHSARFAGANTSYDDKITKLLSMIADTGSDDRSARFVCAMALADGDGRVIHRVEGECRGLIADQPHGTSGFGYDPIFIPDGFAQTFGELSDDVKQRISHRAKAAELVSRFLLHFIAGLT